MNLGELWAWEKKTLPCRIRQESGNPAVDDLRERVAELVGINLTEFLEEGKGVGAGGQAQKGKARRKAKPPNTGGFNGNNGDVTPRPKLSKEVLRTLSCAKELLASVDSTVTVPNRNLLKKFLTVPKSLPPKVVMDVQRERYQLAIGGTNEGGSSGEDEEDGPRQGLSSGNGFLKATGGRTRKKIRRINGKAAKRGKGASSTTKGVKSGTRLLEAGPNPSFGRRAQHANLKTGGTLVKTGSVLSQNEDASLVKVDNPGLTENRRGSRDTGTSSSVFNACYKGDLFGTGGDYMDGMVYMSRLPVGGQGEQPRHGKRGQKQRASIYSGSNPIQDLESRSDTAGESGLGRGGDQHPTNDQIRSQRELEAKTTCATTILAWSRHKDNAQRLAKEGAVEAILKLCHTDNLLLRGYCSAVMKRFAATPVLREKLVARGGIGLIVDMASQCRREVIQTNCMVALVSITCINGQEAKMVEDGLVLGMTTIASEHEYFGRLCATGLFNLTCVSEPYNHLERVLKALVGISGSSSLEVKQLCASAFCNLADLPAMHSRLLEEGAVSMLGSVARGASTKTRRICAIVLHSLASSKQERTNLVTKGSVSVLYGLSNDEDATTVHYVACTLARLGVDEQSHGRMIQEGAASALCNIGMSSAAMPATSFPCALTLNTLSKHAEYQVTIAEEGCIPAIVVLLKSSEDVPTQYHALMTLSSMVTREENDVSVLQQGALTSILALTKHANRSVREACALVLFNLSCGKAVQERIVQAGAVPAIMALSAEGLDMASQRRCAAALCNLACTLANVPRMVEEGVIPSIIHLLKTGDIQCVKYCCAALCIIAQDVSNCVLIINEGAIPHMLAGAKGGDMITKQSCGAVLSALSSKEECREQLCDCGALPALIQLASVDDEATKLRCVIAFANLSCEYTIQGKMVKAGVVSVLSELSISYKEKNQLYCAKAFCNLACHHGSEKALIEEGGVSALMMIALVRSVSLETKQICAKALLNLIGDKTLPDLIDEDIVAVTTNLSKLEDEDSMRACATIFAMLSADARGRARIVRRTSALVSLFDLLRSEDQGTQAICGKAVCNLVCCPDSQLAAVEAGAVPCLVLLAKLGMPEVEATIAMAFLLISGNGKCRPEVTNTALPTLVYLSRSPNAEARYTCARTLSVLSCHEDSRAALYGLGVARALVSIVEGTDTSAAEKAEELEDRLEICTRAMYYLSIDRSSAVNMVKAGTVLALSRVMEVGTTESVLGLIAATLRCLTRVAMPSREDPSPQEASGAVESSENTTEEESTGIAEVLAAQGAGSLVRRVVEATSSTEEGIKLHEATLYECAVVMFSLASTAPAWPELQRDLVGEGGVLPALTMVATVSSTHDLVIATLALLSNDLGSCGQIIMQGGAELTLRLAGGINGWAQQKQEVVTNAVCVLFLMSRGPPLANEWLKEGGKITHFLANLSQGGCEVQKKVANDALGNLTRDVGMGIEEGTVTALISRSLDGPADMDDTADVIGSFYVTPRITPLCIEEWVAGCGVVSSESISYEAQTVTFVKRTSGGGGDLPPPPEPPTMEGEGLSIPAPPPDLKDPGVEEEVETTVKAMLFAKMQVQEEYMDTNDEELVAKMEQQGPIRAQERQHTPPRQFLQRKNLNQDFAKEFSMEGGVSPEGASGSTMRKWGTGLERDRSFQVEEWGEDSSSKKSSRKKRKSASATLARAINAPRTSRCTKTKRPSTSGGCRKTQPEAGSKEFRGSECSPDSGFTVGRKASTLGLYV